MCYFANTSLWNAGCWSAEPGLEAKGLNAAKPSLPQPVASNGRNRAGPPLEPAAAAAAAGPLGLRLPRPPAQATAGPRTAPAAARGCRDYRDTSRHEAGEGRESETYRSRGGGVGRGGEGKRGGASAVTAGRPCDLPRERPPPADSPTHRRGRRRRRGQTWPTRRHRRYRGGRQVAGRDGPGPAPPQRQPRLWAARPVPQALPALAPPQSGRCGGPAPQLEPQRANCAERLRRLEPPFCDRQSGLGCGARRAGVPFRTCCRCAFCCVAFSLALPTVLL